MRPAGPAASGPQGESEPADIGGRGRGASEKRLERGLIQVYTGAGKGKTTAALGLALRAAGWGLKVDIIQFIKGRGITGEVRGIEPLEPRVTITQFGTGRFILKDEPGDVEKELARRALQRATDDFLNGDYDIVILDEVSHAVNKGMITLAELLRLIEKKPDHVELVLTGRDMPSEVVEAADLVTEMVAVKHPYEEGVGARKGIEY
ncbi:MAG: cob(I)yrinic acid a,c-diamide adenosyltransferase [Firmicutes bacterium]|nr:cob(I)yrinic acid a,c-diamide adenosyltransferase [Bacillota bacterium]